jgi:hypothetical protein
MWPFRKRKPIPLILKRRQPPYGPPDLRKIDEETICPACLVRFPSGKLFIAYPFCPDCGSEGMDIRAELFTAYLAGKTVTDFDKMLRRLETADLLPQFKAAMRQRMLDLRALKVAPAA